MVAASVSAVGRAITALGVSTGVSAGLACAVNVFVTPVRLDLIATGFVPGVGSCHVLVMVSATTPQRVTAPAYVILGTGQLTAALSALEASIIYATATAIALPMGRAVAATITCLVTGMGWNATYATGRILVSAASWFAQVVFRTTVAAVTDAAPPALMSVCATPIKSWDTGLGMRVSAASLVTGANCAQGSAPVVLAMHALVVALVFKAQQATEHACALPAIVLGTTRVRSAPNA
mmetsp:Transcript_16508/g.29376  ORF Transcript_16508/g.29376 Transcript_16508/m.29376 type:complete len:236 (+) Transcript_16508:159-866(+)